MDVAAIDALIRELAVTAEPDLDRVLSRLRAATSLDWGTDIDSWTLWWQVQQRAAFEPAAPRPLSSHDEAMFHEALAMGLRLDREEVRGLPDVATVVRRSTQGLWLPDVSDGWSYYLVGAFGKYLHSFLCDLGKPIVVDRDAKAKRLTIVLDGVRSDIVDLKLPRFRGRFGVCESGSGLLGSLVLDG